MEMGEVRRDCAASRRVWRGVTHTDCGACATWSSIASERRGARAWRYTKRGTWDLMSASYCPLSCCMRAKACSRRAWCSGLPSIISRAALKDRRKHAGGGGKMCKSPEGWSLCPCSGRRRRYFPAVEVHSCQTKPGKVCCVALARCIRPDG